MANDAFVEKQKKLRKQSKFKVRQRNYCQICNRARVFRRKFGLCRFHFGALGKCGQLYGVVKK